MAFWNPIDRTGRTSRRTAGAWIWLFPATLAVHFLEELWLHGGFYTWLSAVSGERLPGTMLVPAGVIAVLLAAVAVLLAVRVAGFLWVVPALSSVFLVNAVFHALATLLTGTLSPGTVSAILLWVPLGAGGLAWAYRSLPSRRALLGTALGLVVGLVIVAAVMPFGRV